VRDCCKKVIDGVAGDGGYILDAGAIIQNDAQIENVQAMTEAGREFGVYPGGESWEVCSLPPLQSAGYSAPDVPVLQGPKAGVCRAWEEKRKEIPKILGDEGLVRQVWEDLEGFAHTFIWHCLVSF